MPVADRDLLLEVLRAPGLERPLRVIREKIELYGRAAGRLEVADEAEAFALGGLLGEHLHAGQHIQIARLERRLLQETRFQCTLREAIEVHLGALLVTRPERRATREGAWEAAFTRMRVAVLEAEVGGVAKARLLAWLEADTRELRRRWGKEGDWLAPAMERALQCLAFLPRVGQSRSLAELANAALSDPHALDRDRALASLFDRAVAAVTDGDPIGPGAEARDALLATVGVVPDRTSPKVDTYGLVGRRPDLAGMRDYPLRSFSLRELEAMTEDDLVAPGGVVHVVENASVFDWLVARLDGHTERRPVLLCTNGWLNMADRALLRRLTSAGVELRYSGDMDNRGLAILREVLRAFPSAVPWRMSTGDYHAARKSAERFEAGLLRPLRSSFPELIEAMLGEGAVVYQEALQQRLLDDLLGAGALV